MSWRNRLIFNYGWDNLRGHQVNGEFADITVFRRPYADVLTFAQFLDILATAAGNPPSDPDADFTNASIHIVPEDLLMGDPREVISELLRQPAVAAGAILPHARERATKERIAPTKSASTNRPKNTTVTSAPNSFGPPIKCPPETIE
jgi:hypothetical protein